MSRISFYVFAQLVLAFLVTLFGMTVVLVLGILVNTGMRYGLGLEAILRLLPYELPTALRVSIPATILLAACSIFGRMSSDNEVVAVKSLGINPGVMLAPALVLAALLSVSVIVLNDLAVTWGTHGARKVIAESVEEVAFRLLRTKRYYSNKNFSINVKGVRGDVLLAPKLIVRGEKSLTVDAREARLETDLEKQTLSVALTDLMANFDGREFANDETTVYTFPLHKATKREIRGLSPSKIGLAGISKAVIKQQQNIEAIRRQMATKATYQMVLGNFEQLGDEAAQSDSQTWSDFQQRYDGAVGLLHRLRLEPWRRCAEGCSCFFIVMVGAPMAILFRTANFFTTFAWCFFPILCVYYPLLQWAVDRAKDGAVPPYSVWLGNLVLFAIGLWFIQRVVRH